MIRRLRIKFVCINMTIVTVMLCAIFLTVLYFTKTNLEAESIGMMQTVAMDPMRLNRPDDLGGGGVRLPYFALQMGPGGDLLAVGGGYYDLSDRDFLLHLAAQSEAAGRQTGVLRDYGLRFYRVSTPTVRCIVFADISSELSTMDHLLTYCLLIGAGSFLLFLGISLLLARWAVKPVDLAWQQQRQFVAAAPGRRGRGCPRPLHREYPDHVPQDAGTSGGPAGTGPGRRWAGAAGERPGGLEQNRGRRPAAL